MKMIRNLGKTSQTVEDPFYEDILFAVSSLLPLMNYYVILDDEDHDGNNTYVQAVMSASKNGGVEEECYMVEAHFDGNVQDVLYRQYRTYVRGKDAVMEIFGKYFLGEVIDVTEWADVSDDVRKRVKETKKKDE